MEWEAEIGIISRWEPPWPVLLGQVGFFDQFTVTMNRLAQGLVVENVEIWDQRYPYVPNESSDEWRFPY